MYVINTKELVFITRQNLVGQKFGRLVVTKMLFNYKNTNITYNKFNSVTTKLYNGDIIYTLCPIYIGEGIV